MLRTAFLLLVSNVFMTFAWYAHLRDLRDRPLWVAIAASWGIAFFEYCVQVPANRHGYGSMSLSQLKVMQEIITMVVFAVFAWSYMGQRLGWNFLGATACMIGAAWFVSRG
jgi:uncharacterized protein (DUF486 family)